MALLTESWKLDILALLIGAITAFYLFIKRSYSYWDRKGFKTLPGFKYFTGHLTELFLQKESLALLTNRLYKLSNEPFVGIYSMFRPVLFVNDPDLARSILIKDFAHFTDRGIHCNESYDPLSGHLVALPGERWKNMRSKLTPTFSSGKLKAMFSTFINAGLSLQNYLEKLVNTDNLLDVRDTAACYSTDVIASVAFGVEVDTITDPNNDFRKFGRKIFERSFWTGLRQLITITAPSLMSLFRIKSADASVEHFIRSLVKQTLEYREQNNVVRKDFFQLLIQLRNNGTVQLDDEWKTVIKANENQKSLTVDQIAAQVYVFYVAGFETSSTTLSYCLYELAKQPEIQQKVHEELDNVLGQHSGQITYESIAELKYLEACIKETLRKYPPAAILGRICVKEYQIPGTDKIIEKGTQVFIPSFAMQRDEKYYEEPLKFNPERFLDDSMERSRPYLPYLPFGDGPRNCIGMRMGLLQTKVGLVMMLQKFKFDLEEKLKNREIEFNPKTSVLAPLETILLHVSKRL